MLGSAVVSFLTMPQGVFNPAYILGYMFGMIAMCFLVAGIAFVFSLLIRRTLNSEQLLQHRPYHFRNRARVQPHRNDRRLNIVTLKVHQYLEVRRGSECFEVRIQNKGLFFRCE